MNIKRYIGNTEISREISPNIKYIDNQICETIINVRRRILRNHDSEKSNYETKHLNSRNNSK